MTSSMYVRHDVNFSPARTKSIIRWKLALADARPNGMTLNCHRPSGVIKADFGRSTSRSGICQKPDSKSSDVKTVEP